MLPVVGCLWHPSEQIWGPMSALGQKQTFRNVSMMSALPPRADIGTQLLNVRFVPKADICTAANLDQNSARTLCLDYCGRISTNLQTIKKQVFT